KAFDENIPGVGPYRELVQWAHNEDTKVGDIQLFNNNNNAFIVAILTQKNEEGYMSLENMKEAIRPSVIQHKKAEQFKKKMNEAVQRTDDISELAQNLSLPVKNQVAAFNNTAISGYGSEPKVVGAMTGLEAGKLSKSIDGANGVFVVQV